MEALSTYKNIQEIADRAAGGYEEKLDGQPSKFAKWIVAWYQSEDAPEPIRSNAYFKHLLKCYPGTVENEVIKILERRKNK